MMLGGRFPSRGRAHVLSLMGIGGTWWGSRRGGIQAVWFERRWGEDAEGDAHAQFSLWKKSALGILVPVRVTLKDNELVEVSRMKKRGKHISLQNCTVAIGKGNCELVVSLPESKEVRYFAEDHRQFHSCVDAIRSTTLSSFSFNYRRGPQLGKGKNGTVYECMSKNTNKAFAVKVIDKRQQAFGNATSAVEWELEIVKSVDHQYLVKTYETYESSTSFYLVMELMPDGECSELLVERGPLDEKSAMRIMYQVFMALSFLHSKSIVHRDVKLENVLLRDKDTLSVKLADFGLSKTTGPNFEREALNSQVGTYMYMAPEILKNKMYGPQVDMWAAGVLLYVFLSANFPFQSSDDVGRLRKLLHGQVEMTDACWDNVSVRAKDLIRSLLQVEPEDRPTADQALGNQWVLSNPPEEVEGAWMALLMSSRLRSFDGRVRELNGDWLSPSQTRLSRSGSRTSPRVPRALMRSKSQDSSESVAPRTAQCPSADSFFYVQQSRKGTNKLAAWTRPRRGNT